MIDLFHSGSVFIALVFVTLQGVRIDYLERQLVEVRGRPADPKEFRLGAVLRPIIPIVTGFVAALGLYRC